MRERKGYCETLSFPQDSEVWPLGECGPTWASLSVGPIVLALGGDLAGEGVFRHPLLLGDVEFTVGRG